MTTRGVFSGQESLPRLFKRPEESDIFHMVWHILSAGDYIRSSSWSITSEQERAPTLILMSSFVNDTSVYEDRRGMQHRVPWRNSSAAVLLGGTAGVDYQLTNRITTNTGRVLRRTGHLSIIDRYPDIDRFENTARFQS